MEYQYVYLQIDVCLHPLGLTSVKHMPSLLTASIICISFDFLSVTESVPLGAGFPHSHGSE